MFDVGFNDAVRVVTRSRQRFLLSISLAVTAVFVIAASFGAANASAAFSVTDFKVTPTKLQAASHPGVNLKVTLDAAAGDKTSDDLKTASIDLPAGLVLNPQAVTTPCTSTQLSSDSCPPASLVGNISLQYKVGSSTITSPGSVYSTTPDMNNALNFGFVVRPTSSYKKFSFSGARATGLTTIRTAPDADFGMNVSLPMIPATVTSNIGLSVAMTISSLSIDLNPRSGATQTGPYFVINPTRCNAANSRATLVSVKAVSFTKTSSFTPIGCSAPKFSPDFAIAATDTTQGASTGFTATTTIATNELDIQSSEIQSLNISLPPAATLDMNSINAVSTVCTDAWLTADTCPPASQIGTASAITPYLPSGLNGSIYLVSKTGGVKVGLVLRGVRGAHSISRGTIGPDAQNPGRFSVLFPTLPQIPLSSTTLNITSKIVKNPLTCGTLYAYAGLVGYTGAQAGINTAYPVNNCPPPPDTTLVGPTGTIGYNNPSYSFTSPTADATFECRIDGKVFFACTSPYQMTGLTDGYHHFEARAVKNGAVDPTPGLAIILVDDTPPILNVTSPTEGTTINGNSVTVNFTAEEGATLYCRLDNTGLKTCASPKTYTDLTPGSHLVLVAAIDSVGNIASVTRHFTIAADPHPVVTITAPADGSTLAYQQLVPSFTGTSPSGSALTYHCSLIISYPEQEFEYEIDDGPCTSGKQFSSFVDQGQFYKLVVTAKDTAGLTGEATVGFFGGNPRPFGPHTEVGGLGGDAVTTDRTPTFTISGGGGPTYPSVTYECSLDLATVAPTFVPCGAPPSYTFTAPTALPNGDYRFSMRSRSGSDYSFEGYEAFTVANWDVSYTATTSTQQAGAHPDLDVDIKPAAGQFRTLDMLLPKGLIGSLNSFPKCPLAQVPTARDCPANTQVGTVATTIYIVGFSIDAIGRVYLTEPQVPGDAAGLTIFVQSPLPDSFDNVVIPLRLQLVNNSQQMRVFSNTIPVTTKYFGDTTVDANFYVQDFAMHLNGSAGSPFPLLTNPSSCAVGGFSTVFGDTESQKTAALPIPYTATGCSTVPFAPTFAQTFSKPVAGSTTGVTATITAPEGSSSFRQIRVVEPTLLAPNYPAFGDPADQCPSGSAPAPTSLFDPTNCPTQSLVGHMEIKSPVLPTTVTGDVYLINKSPLPWFGVVIKAPQYGVDVRLTGVTSLPQVVPSCDPASDGFCQSQIAVSFGNAPDLPVTSIKFDLSGPTRTGVGGVQLSGDMVAIASPGDSTCVSPAPVAATLAPNTGTAAVPRSVQQLISGC